MNQSAKTTYQQYKPHRKLESYIDAFWTVISGDVPSESGRIMPDGCVDIILNLGSEFKTDNGTVSMESHHAYLVGTMTLYKDVPRPPGSKLIGIRFKPGVFPCFYDCQFLGETANKTVEFDKKLIPPINNDTKDLYALLNRFFIDRLSVPGQTVFGLIEDIDNLRGQVTVDDLAKRHSISTRQLERQFKLYLDISPKEYINFVRCQSALEKIRNNQAKKSLLEIAFESGYYDHSHLSNEIKKHTGTIPSEL